MRHLKNFSLFEELDTDAKKDNMMRDSKEKMMSMAKGYEEGLKKKGLKMITENVRDDNSYNKMWKEALDKVKEGGETAYGMMKWSGDICQSISIICPVKGIEVLRKPVTDFHMNISYREEPNSWCTLQIFSTPGDGKSTYMENDGEVLFQWNSYENKAKGKLA